MQTSVVRTLFSSKHSNAPVCLGVISLLVLVAHTQQQTQLRKVWQRVKLVCTVFIQ